MSTTQEKCCRILYAHLLGYVRKSRIPKAEAEVCERLRYAREKILEITQEGCAKQIGLDRSTLANYETRRTPLRYEVALRFCRQFIISEEWLATGRHDACHAEAPKHGVAIGQGIEMVDKLIFFRQCVDLLSEPSALHISTGTLFKEAYDKVLAPEYSRLVHDFFYLPRIVFSDSDNPELVGNLLNAINERFMVLLGNEAIRRGQKRSSAWRVYARCVLESADLVFRKMMRFKSDPKRLNDLDWLKHCVTDPEAIIEFLEERTAIGLADSSKKEFDNVTVESNMGGVKSKISETQKLRDDLKHATAKPGMKAKLARFMKVDPPRVSEWLSGQEPGGEYALKLRAWADEQLGQKSKK